MVKTRIGLLCSPHVPLWASVGVRVVDFCKQFSFLPQRCWPIHIGTPLSSNVVVLLLPCQLTRSRQTGLFCHHSIGHCQSYSGIVLHEVTKYLSNETVFGVQREQREPRPVEEAKGGTDHSEDVSYVGQRESKRD